VPAVSWTPLLEGEARAHALTTVEALAMTLRSRRGSTHDATLANGAAGEALAFGYLAEAVPGQGYEDDAIELLELAASELSDAPLGPNLFEGYVGVGIVSAILQPRLFEEPDDEALVEIEEALRAALAQPDRIPDDLMVGLAGVIVYGLVAGERVRDIVELALAELGRRAVRRDDRVTWAMEARHYGVDAAVTAAGYYNLGVAHGVPGILAALGGAHAAGHTGARSLLDGAISWLGGQARGGRPDVYPRYVGPPDDGQITRLAWCYGDLGIAGVLSGVAIAIDDGAVSTAAYALATKAAARPELDSGVECAGLCHGSMGIVHQLNRLWQRSGDPELATAARRWLPHVWRMGEKGVSGYGPVRPDLPFGSLLAGASGVMVALAAACSEIEPYWDVVFGLSPA
jgi:lantibiotic modifying enzyme